MIPVILSGGSGTRLWPLSRKHYPKQFLSLFSEHSLFQETLLRLAGIDGLQAPIAVCNESHRFILADQLRAVAVEPLAIILEPVGRNTAPAAALAALSAPTEDAILLVLPADHVIVDVEAFQATVKHAEKLAAQGNLVTFGVMPTGAETGYGYIKKGDKHTEHAFNVDSFVEKPDAPTAQRYLDSGDYLWNSGMFVFKASRYLEELEKYHPEMVLACRKAHRSAQVDADFVRIERAVFAQCRSDSIDFAVMEKTDQAVVIPLASGWNDVGSWASWWEVSAKDDHGNTVSGDVIATDTHNCLVHAQHRLVTTVGLHDLIVIETPDAVMVADKARAQDVKTIVDQLKTQQRCELVNHRKVHRPWGYYDLIDSGTRYNAKRIMVNPGEKLSLQKHHHRAEHWIVVQGTALVRKGEEEILLSENESTYIPLGVLHSLENPGVITLEMIEVQSGSYLGEDDIVRYDDKYGRA